MALALETVTSLPSDASFGSPFTTIFASGAPSETFPEVSGAHGRSGLSPEGPSGSGIATSGSETSDWTLRVKSFDSMKSEGQWSCQNSSKKPRKYLNHS